LNTRFVVPTAPHCSEPGVSRSVDLAHLYRLAGAWLFGLLGGAMAPAAAPVHAGPELSVVYAQTEGKYEVIRTPQLLATRAGTLLVFAQGRSGSHDASDNDIIVKRSTDRGRTWSPLQVLADQGADSFNSICVVQLRETSRILLVGCQFPAGHAMMEFKYLSPGIQAYQQKAGRDRDPVIQPGYDGPSIQRNYVLHSDDDGRTWSPRRDITRLVKPPAPDIACIPGPGVAIELREGPHAGRVVVPCYTRGLRTRDGKTAYVSKPYAVFSDDRGATWQRGEVAPSGEAAGEDHGDETQMVELPGGILQLNTRARGRNTALSRDGGRTWTPLRDEPGLRTSPTAAGIIRYSGVGDGQRSRLLFSNPSESGRQRGVVALSYDDGRTWPVQKTLREDRFSYSCLARLPDDAIGCVFDGAAAKGEFPGHAGRGVLLARFTLAWLTDHADGPP